VAKGAAWPVVEFAGDCVQFGPGWRREGTSAPRPPGGAAVRRLTTGGGRPAGLERGWFVQPTVFADVDNGSAIAQEEIFGPVLAITPYDDEEEAVHLANDSVYGLGGSVWTADVERGAALARRIRTGTIGVNGYLPEPLGSLRGREGQRHRPRVRSRGARQLPVDLPARGVTSRPL
jgi:hypothetical protein